MIGLGLVPLSGVRFKAAFEQWAAKVRPSDAELLTRRDADLSDAAAAAAAAGDGAREIRLKEVRHRLRMADDRQRASHAGMTWLAEKGTLESVFLGAFRRGDLVARVLIDNSERSIAPTWWAETTFWTAARHPTAIYVDATEFAGWLAVAAEPLHRRRHSTLVELCRDRASDGRIPSEASDLAAATERFGIVTRSEIRRARDEAHGAGAKKRGRPAA